MKKTICTLIICLIATHSFASNILNEGFEYANHDLTTPVGWICPDNSWLCGYQEKDHNRIPHSGDWYAFSDSENAWLYMPIDLFESMRYRFTLWTISDGSFQLELWAGSSLDNMHTQFSSTTISSGEYEKVSIYVDTIPADCHYFGIRAFSNNRTTHLTIDDIEIDMVEKYTFTAEPITGDTAMYPGTQAFFHFLVHNTGYEPVDVTAHPSNEYFTDFTCTVNGVAGMTFPTEPDEIVEVTMQATLRPEIEPGTVAWLDIIMTIPCNCNTAMVTFWVTPLDLTQTDENNTMEINIFPNPTTDFVQIQAEGLQLVRVIDLTGKTVMTIPSHGNLLRLDVSSLKSGIYYLSATTENGIITRVLMVN